MIEVDQTAIVVPVDVEHKMGTDQFSQSLATAALFAYLLTVGI